MMAEQTIRKILGKRSRITIPWEIRRELKLVTNDVLRFTRQGNTVTVVKEKLCDDCRSAGSPPLAKAPPLDLAQLLDSLSPSEQRAALIHLSVRWAQSQEGGENHA